VLGHSFQEVNVIRVFDKHKRAALVDLLDGSELAFGLVHRWMQENRPKSARQRDALYESLPPEFALLVIHLSRELTRLVAKHGEEVIDDLFADIDDGVSEYMEQLAVECGEEA
jgi:hypothetical protein